MSRGISDRHPLYKPIYAYDRAIFCFLFELLDAMTVYLSEVHRANWGRYEEAGSIRTSGRSLKHLWLKFWSHDSVPGTVSPGLKYHSNDMGAIALPEIAILSTTKLRDFHNTKVFAPNKMAFPPMTPHNTGANLNRQSSAAIRIMGWKRMFLWKPKDLHKLLEWPWEKTLPLIGGIINTLGKNMGAGLEELGNSMNI